MGTSVDIDRDALRTKYREPDRWRSSGEFEGLEFLP